MNKKQARREARRCNKQLQKQQSKQMKKLGQKLDKWIRSKAPDDVKKDYVLAKEIAKRTGDEND